MTPSIADDRPFTLPPHVLDDGPNCRLHRCRFAFRQQDGYWNLVHQDNGRYSMLSFSEAEIEDLECDIWGERFRPWVRRLHEETAA